MTTLPPLADWVGSSHSLHAAAPLLSALRQLAFPHVPGFYELALRVESTGLSTDVLPGGGVVLLSFAQAAVVYTPARGEAVSIALADHTQASLLEALLEALDTGGEGLVQHPTGSQSHTQTLMAALDALDSPFHPQREHLTSDAPLHVEPSVSADYGHALYRVFTAVARFRARLNGPQTPLVVWPEHFDLSTLWYPTDDRSDAAPVMNFGFAPFDGGTEQPYLYAYAYPMPEGFERLPLPSPARWHTEGWKGAFVAYDDLAHASDPEALIEKVCEEVYRLLAPTLPR